MSLFEVGRVVIKTSGRDSGNTGVVVEVMKDNYVLIDGNVRRKKCNVRHLEPLKETLNIKKNETHENVIKAMKQANINIIEKRIRSKAKGVKIRPKKTKNKKVYEKTGAEKSPVKAKKTNEKTGREKGKDDKGKK